MRERDRERGEGRKKRERERRENDRKYFRPRNLVSANNVNRDL